MMAKPMKTLELHYPMIQFLIISDIPQLLLRNIRSHDVFRPVARKRKYLMNYNVQYSVLFCYVVPCCAMLCHVALCCALLSYVVLCRLLCCSMLCHVLLCATTLSKVVFSFQVFSPRKQQESLRGELTCYTRNPRIKLLGKRVRNSGSVSGFAVTQLDFCTPHLGRLNAVIELMWLSWKHKIYSNL